MILNQKQILVSGHLCFNAVKQGIAYHTINLKTKIVVNNEMMINDYAVYSLKYLVCV